MIRSQIFSGIGCHLLMVGQETAASRTQIEDAASQLRDAGYETSCDIKPGQSEKVIAAEVETGGYGLLVMGAYGHSRIRNLIIGSTTTEMIRSCMIPVLLYR